MLCEERSPFLCLTACFLFCIKFWSSIYFLRFHLNSSKMFSQARVQFLLSCTVTAPHCRRHTFVEEGVMVLLFWRRVLIFLLAPSPESGWGHVPPLEAPLPGAMWSSGWQLCLHSWWESLSSSWSGVCPLSRASTAPCTYRLWKRWEQREGEKRTTIEVSQRWDNGEQIEEMGVQTNTRSGGEAGTVAPGWDKGIRIVSALFLLHCLTSFQDKTDPLIETLPQDSCF